MADKSLLHFSIFLCLLFGYLLYEQKEYISRMEDDMLKVEELIIDQQEAIKAQALYIKLLETKFMEDQGYYSDPQNRI
tara:strand:- start:2008 stop:2241 length:234 start_codon:yes stop_codon:yes gene_type:complete